MPSATAYKTTIIVYFSLKRVFSMSQALGQSSSTYSLICPCARENSPSRGAAFDRTRHSPECELRISEVLSEFTRMLYNWAPPGKDC